MFIRRYTIPGEYKEKFDEYFRKKYAHLLKNKPDLLYNIVLMINPLELIENDVNFIFYQITRVDPSL